jgi:hypothetical protein
MSVFSLMKRSKKMNDYERKQQERKERYEELAESHRKRSNERYNEARKIGSLIPFGQPILVGHHSERGHRSALKKIDNNMRKSIEHDETADYYEQKAKSVGKGGISSDDPDAIKKLQSKLDDLEATQTLMKAANLAIRKKDVEKGNVELVKLGFTDGQISSLREGDFAGRIGFAPYQLQNNNANIRRIRERIEQLQKAAEREHQEREYSDVKLVQNVEENRIQIIFPDKPNDAILGELKANGFRWSPKNNAWQRHLNNAGIFKAKKIAEWIEKDLQGKWQ